jgi:hypothetical protein
MQDVKLVLEAPNVYVGAAVLIKQSFYNGKGDRTAFIEVVLNTDPSTIPDLGRKLKLITMSEWYGYKIYNDKLCNTMNICKKNIFKLWLHCTRIHKIVSLAEMLEFAPYMKEKLLIWDKHVDNTGRTTLNMPEYMEFRKKCAEIAKLAAKKKQAD